MTKILRHYIPDIDINLSTLRSLTEELEHLSENDGEQAFEFSESPLNLQTPVEDQTVHEVALSKDTPVIEEIGFLHEQLGCLMIDSGGNYREF
jgi:hypothetical protein